LADASDWIVEHGGLWLIAAVGLHCLAYIDGVIAAREYGFARFNMLSTLLATQAAIVGLMGVGARRAVRTPQFRYAWKRELAGLLGVVMLCTAGFTSVAAYTSNVQVGFESARACLGADGHTIEVVSRRSTATCDLGDALLLGDVVQLDRVTGLFVTSAGQSLQLHGGDLLSGREAEYAFRHGLIDHPDRPLLPEGFTLLALFSVFTYRYANGVVAIGRALGRSGFIAGIVGAGLMLLEVWIGGAYWKSALVALGLVALALVFPIVRAKKFGPVEASWPLVAAGVLALAVICGAPSPVTPYPPVWSWAGAGWVGLGGSLLLSPLFAHIDSRVGSLPNAIKTRPRVDSRFDRQVVLPGWAGREGDGGASRIAIPFVSPAFRIALALLCGAAVFIDTATRWRGWESLRSERETMILAGVAVASVLAWRGGVVLAGATIVNSVAWRRRALAFALPALAAVSIPVGFAAGDIARQLQGGVAEAEVEFCESVQWNRNAQQSHVPRPGFCEIVMDGRPARAEMLAPPRRGYVDTAYGPAMQLLGNVSESRVPPIWFTAMESAVWVFVAMQLLLMIATLRTGRRVRWPAVVITLVLFGVSCGIALSATYVPWTLEPPSAAVLLRPAFVFGGLGACGLCWIRTRATSEAPHGWYGQVLLFWGSVAGMVPLTIGLMSYGREHWTLVTPFLVVSIVASVVLFAPVQNACARIRAQPM
jgi:hypothetical protein